MTNLTTITIHSKLSNITNEMYCGKADSVYVNPALDIFTAEWTYTDETYDWERSMIVRDINSCLDALTCGSYHEVQFDLTTKEKIFDCEKEFVG